VKGTGLSLNFEGRYLLTKTLILYSVSLAGPSAVLGQKKNARELAGASS
jgi:hypothetical protein